MSSVAQESEYYWYLTPTKMYSIVDSSGALIFAATYGTGAVAWARKKFRPRRHYTQKPL